MLDQERNNSLIAITAGEPASIAPFISLKMWLELEDVDKNRFFIIANYDFMKSIANFYSLGVTMVSFDNLDDIYNYQEENSNICEIKLIILNIKFDYYQERNNKDLKDFLGKRDYENSKYVLESLDLAINLCLEGKIKALVTNPIDKDLVDTYLQKQIDEDSLDRKLMFGKNKFVGHTGYLAKRAGLEEEDVVMMMATNHSRLKVAMVTTHIALNEVAKSISVAKIKKKLKIIDKFFREQYKIQKPTIFVTGLNPHCGENGLMGNEEAEHIRPAIYELKKEGVNVVGAIPADTVFVKAQKEECDIVLGMYHDQVLGVFKTLHFDDGVNVTLGLPFIRTSPDHGCAFDLAKTNEASWKSLYSATMLAKKLIA